MYRTVMPPAVVIAISVLISPPVIAQHSAPRQQDSESQHSGSRREHQFELRASFDDDPIDGWEFFCQRAFVAAGKGRALATSGCGGAVWARAGEFEDFIMKFRHGYEKGIADVSFHGSESSGSDESYHLMLHEDHVVLVRRQHLPDGTFPERELVVAPASLPPKTWHDVIIQVKGGQIDIWIDGRGVLSFQDPDPLGCGLCSLGVIAHSGVVLYDDVVLIADRPSYQHSLTTDPATWVSGSAAEEVGRGVEPLAPRGGSSSQGIMSSEAFQAKP